MDLTENFNSASHGPSGESASVAGPGPGPHQGPSSDAAAIPEQTHETPAQETTPVDLTATFNEAAGVEEVHEPQSISADSAQAELETLEQGRAKPEATHTAEPPTPLKRGVDAEVERRREVRIAQLKAYLEWVPQGPEHEAEPELGHGLELSL